MQSDWPTPFGPYEKDDRNVRWKKTKNKFHHHSQIIAWC